MQRGLLQLQGKRKRYAAVFWSHTFGSARTRDISRSFSAMRAALELLMAAAQEKPTSRNPRADDTPNKRARNVMNDASAPRAVIGCRPLPVNCPHVGRVAAAENI